MTNGTDITRTKTYQYDSSNGLLSRKTLPGGVTTRVTQGTDTIVPNSIDYYKEYVHPTPGVNGPGPQRIIKGGNGEIYFTPDHYHFFIKIR